MPIPSFERFADGLLARLDQEEVPSSLRVRECRLVEDLALDSLDLFRVLIFVEEFSGELVLDEEPPAVPTLGDVYEYAVRLRTGPDA